MLFSVDIRELTFTMKKYLQTMIMMLTPSSYLSKVQFHSLHHQ